MGLEIKSITVKLNKNKKINVKNTIKYIPESELGKALLIVISQEEENLRGGKWILLRNLAANCRICIPLCQLIESGFVGFILKLQLCLLNPVLRLETLVGACLPSKQGRKT